jgi:hypothetical protein
MPSTALESSPQLILYSVDLFHLVLRSVAYSFSPGKGDILELSARALEEKTGDQTAGSKERIRTVVVYPSLQTH